MKLTIQVRSIIILASILLIGGFGTATRADSDQHTLTHVTPPEIMWEVSPFGPEMWKVQGDFLQGAHVTYIKFAAGTTTPLHIHSEDYVGIVVAGTTRHTIRGKLETWKLLPPGSHWFIPANVGHVSECLSGFECIMAITQKAAFDFIPLE
jgi:hypothetical protein